VSRSFVRRTGGREHRANTDTAIYTSLSPRKKPHTYSSCILTIPLNVMPSAVIPSATNCANKANGPTLVRVSDEDLANGTTSLDTLQACMEAFHRDGVVVLYNAIPEELIDKLNKKMTEDSIRIQDLEGTHFHQGKNTKNMSVAPPLTKEWIMREFWANAHVVKIVEHVLGPKPELVFVRSNSTLPRTTGRQAVHSDVPKDHLNLPFMVIANIFLCEVTPYVFYPHVLNI
jgi:hypothetical protein